MLNLVLKDVPSKALQKLYALTPIANHKILPKALQYDEE